MLSLLVHLNFCFFTISQQTCTCIIRYGIWSFAFFLLSSKIAKASERQIGHYIMQTYKMQNTYIIHILLHSSWHISTCFMTSSNRHLKYIHVTREHDLKQLQVNFTKSREALKVLHRLFVWMRGYVKVGKMSSQFQSSQNCRRKHERKKSWHFDPFYCVDSMENATKTNPYLK